jgi:cytochrome b561
LLKTGKNTSMIGGGETYSCTARHFHWWTVGFVAVLVPVGLYMNYRGNILGIFDELTNSLYSTHKLLGSALLLIVIARLGYRLSHGAPADEPTLEPWQKVASHVNHWGMYALLLIVPLLGWFGVQLFPALEIFGLFSLPAVVSPDQATAKVVLAIHKALALLLVAFMALHVAAALYHYLIRKDGVLHRMIPMLPRREAR